MWDCNPVLTPMDTDVRLTKRDSPEVVDPRLHRRMRSIMGCLSYLVIMTRPDLAFTYSQLSKFVQSDPDTRKSMTGYLFSLNG